MASEILINVAAGQTRVAHIDHGLLQQVHIQSEAQRVVIGNVYLGKVQRVLPGMQAAFVDVGLERTAFLHATNIAAARPGADQTSQVNRADQADPANRAPALIETLLSPGDPVLVQVFKEPLGSKGAGLTTRLSLPTRSLVLMPDNPRLAVSARIESLAERDRLHALMSELTESRAAPGGFIVRTAAEGADADTLAADIRFLDTLWANLRARAVRSTPPALIHGDLPLATRMLRDMLAPGVERIRIDNAEAFAQMQEFAATYAPELHALIEHYDSDAPIFDLYAAEDELERALTPRVGLKSGGHIVIEQTEAMTTVDVNSGAFVGSHTLADTALRTNLEAAHTVARQLRLRNLGGIIIIDFIDMPDLRHREQVMRTLQAALDKDPARSSVSPISRLGLVEMTRKRTRESLEHTLCEPCETCGGRGSVKTPATVCQEIFRELARSARQYACDEMLVLANAEVIAMLVDDLAPALAELSEQLGHPIRLQSEVLFQQEQFDVVLM